MDFIYRIKDAVFKKKVYAKSGFDFLKYVNYVPLGAPLSKKEVEDFETLNNISLPDDYKFFLTHIGNGIRIFMNNRYSKIIRRIKSTDRIVLGIERPVNKQYNKMLQKDCIFDTAFDDQVTRRSTDLFEDCIDPVRVYNDIKCEKCHHFDICPFADGIELPKEQMPYYSGVYPICKAGCTYQYCLIVTGKHRGEVWMDNELSTFIPMKENFTQFLRWLVTADFY